MRYLLPLLLLTSPLFAQTDYGAYYGITCSTRDTVRSFRPAPAAFLNGTTTPKAEFILTFTDEVPSVARTAIQFAAGVWGSYLRSEVPIRVEIDWAERDNPRVLASAGPGTLIRGFGGAEPNTWYPVALAESIAGRSLNADDRPDIVVSANSGANWYFPTDGRTPRGQIDLVSVMLHELGHGLGFLSSVDTINENQLQVGFDGRFIIYDIFLETPDGLALTDANLFRNPSPELFMAVTTDDLFFAGDRAVDRNGGNIVPLFAPSTFDVGSSVSHLEERAYPPGSPNALMTPFLASGEAAHDPGPITLGIFRDMGWEVDFTVARTQVQGWMEARLYPNPAHTTVRLEIPPAANASRVIVFDVNGRALLNELLPPGVDRLDMDLSAVPAGLYAVHTYTGVHKLVVR